MKPLYFIFSILLVFGFASRVSAQASSVGRVEGVVTDSASGRPAAAAEVTLVNGSRRAVTDANGVFKLEQVPEGDWLLSVRRVGSRSAQLPVTVKSGEVSKVQIRLTPVVILLQEVLSTASAGSTKGTVVLEGEVLARVLGSSIASTIAQEPGVVQRYNGPMAAQPVVRGLTGDRVLVLEDGQRTGDIATTAADHAVTIDPLGAERVELLRGPAGLLYGGNAVGGVVNVVRNDVPVMRREGWTGSLRLHGESVNSGITAGGSAAGTTGPVTWRGAYTQRHATDTRTARGPLPFTDLDSYDLGAGASWVGNSGHIGVSVQDYTAFYGIPSTFNGVTIPGAHDGGVYVDLRRSTVRLSSEYRRDNDPKQSFKVDAGYVRFEQDELEQGGMVGTRFGQLQSTAQFQWRYLRSAWLPSSGTSGISYAKRDLRAVGSYTGTRPAVLTTAGLFAMEQYALGRVELDIGGRYDHTSLKPYDTTSSKYLRNPRDVSFNALSGSVALSIPFSSHWKVGASAARAYRIPAIEELYSNGPHLANYAYEVGNPDLGVEAALGVDAFVQLSHPRVAATATVFRNSLKGFIYHAPILDSVSGMPVLDYRLHRYFVYQASQTDALLTGFELQTQLHIGGMYAVNFTGSSTRGTDTRAKMPLPAIPPTRARVDLSRDASRWFSSIGVEAVAKQNRVPLLSSVELQCAPEECLDIPGEFIPTPSYILVHGVAGIRRTIGRTMHTITLKVDNAGNSAWHDHLSRIKTVAPQPGRNISLLYQVTR